MVVGKVMRWSPSAPAPAKAKKRYLVRVRIARLEGLPELGGERVVAVGIRWKGPPRAAGLAYFMGRRTKQVRGVSKEAAVGEGGVAEWPAAAPEAREENEFENVCCFSNPFRPWDVSFSVLQGFNDEDKGRKEKKLSEIGRTSVNLVEWVQDFQSKVQDGDNESHLYVQKKQIPIILANDCSANLHVNVSLFEVRTSDEGKEIQANVVEQSAQEEETSDGQLTDGSCTFDTSIPDLTQLLKLADETDKLATYNSRRGSSTIVTSTTTSNSNSGESSPELQFESVSKSKCLYWRKKRKNDNKNNDSCEIGSKKAQDSSTFNTTHTDNILDADLIGKWVNKEIISRDKKAKLKAQTFFASIDQRDESAGGESACTALVVVIADALHSNKENIPNMSEFEALIKEGSSEWKRLCDNETYIARFPDKHFDLDTILEAKIRSLSVSPEKSFIGFFKPESFKSLHGAMSFEDIWDQISNDAREGDSKVYIVSWNDHFFLLKVEADAYYILDTLGERLFEGCNKAYILRFDDLTEMYRIPENRGSDHREELICSGKECCREFIKEFLAAIPLREELELEEKGKGSGNAALHQRLQIEFHHTESCDKMMKYNDECI